MLMSCSRPELSDKLLLYVEKELSGDEEMEITSHISQCPQCGSEIEGLKAMVSGLKISGGAPLKSDVHPGTDELTRFFYSRENLDEKNRLRISEHVFQCPQCMEEVKLLMECPDIDESISPEDTVKVPVELAKTFNRLYGGKKQSELVTVESIKPHSLWDRLWQILTPQFRFAYASAFVILLLIMSSVVIFGPNFAPGTHNGDTMLSYKGNTKFIEFPMDQIDGKEKDGFTLYLINNGIPVQIQDGKVLVRKDRMDEAREQLAAYKDRNMIALATAEGTGVPSDFVPTAKGGSPPDQGTGNLTNEPGSPAKSPLVPDLTEALEGNRSYPTVSPNGTGKPTQTPSPYRIAKGSIKEGSGDEWIPMPNGSKDEKNPSEAVLVNNTRNGHIKTTDLKTSIRIQNAFLEMEADYKDYPRSFTTEPGNKNPRSFLNSTPGIRTADSDGGMISSSQEEDNDTPLSLDELEARERSTERIQTELKHKIQNILDQNTKLPPCKVKVFITLSFQKDRWNKYMVRSVTVYIEHAGPLTVEQKDQLKVNIKKELKWQDIWDERFVFEPAQ